MIAAASLIRLPVGRAAVQVLGAAALTTLAACGAWDVRRLGVRAGMAVDNAVSVAIVLMRATELDRVQCATAGC
ncbi:hypothetical protein [Ralstonia sp. UBA689]|uniref:hypothetical protein n=1 Tax=Ralstonia sp. UBA689 TaxID=1947373 RepID=UPI0025DD842A|nr:hypothetical protein [Ralstonia sp. UBA689]